MCVFEVTIFRMFVSDIAPTLKKDEQQKKDKRVTYIVSGREVYIYLEEQGLVDANWRG